MKADRRGLLLILINANPTVCPARRAKPVACLIQINAEVGWKNIVARVSHASIICPEAITQEPRP